MTGYNFFAEGTGTLVNFALLLALLFWPSGEAPTRTFAEPRPDAPLYRASGGPVSTDRLARATRSESGRRAF
jgi:hypothetical protein